MSSFSVFEIEPDGVSELVDKMESFECFLIENDCESFLPFIRAYRKITEKVQESMDIFDSPGELEKLDLKLGEETALEDVSKLCRKR